MLTPCRHPLLTPHTSLHPYLQILDRWLWEGVLDDPHSEFMVQEVKVGRGQEEGGRGGGEQGVCVCVNIRGRGGGHQACTMTSPLTLLPSGYQARRPHLHLPLPPSLHAQGIGRDDLTSDGQLAFWYTRYMLRQAHTQQQGAQQQQQGVLDIPLFLQAHADTILTTGEKGPDWWNRRDEQGMGRA